MKFLPFIDLWIWKRRSQPRLADPRYIASCILSIITASVTCGATAAGFVGKSERRGWKWASHEDQVAHFSRPKMAHFVKTVDNKIHKFRDPVWLRENQPFEHIIGRVSWKVNPFIAGYYPYNPVRGFYGLIFETPFLKRGGGVRFIFFHNYRVLFYIFHPCLNLVYWGRKKPLGHICRVSSL